MTIEDYGVFLASKSPAAEFFGFDIEPDELHQVLLPHQRAIVRWALKGGRRAIFAAFGLGKSVMQLEIMRQVLQREGGRCLIVCPLGVRQEFMRDARELLGTETTFVRWSDDVGNDGIYLTNYESVRDGRLDPAMFKVVSLDEASVLRSFGSKTYQTFLTLFDSVPYRFVATATPVAFGRQRQTESNDERTSERVTLLVALNGADGLVLAADSRGTFGDPRGVTAQNDAQQKAHVLAPHVAVLAAGSGEVGSIVIDRARQNAAPGLDHATPVLEHLRTTVRTAYNEWFPAAPAMVPLALLQAGQVASRPDLAFIVGGYEPDGCQALATDVVEQVVQDNEDRSQTLRESFYEPGGS